MSCHAITEGRMTGEVVSLRNSINSLPQELLLSMFILCDNRKDILNISLVCRKWMIIMDDQFIWKSKVYLRFGFEQKVQSTWKDEYNTLSALENNIDRYTHLFELNKKNLDTFENNVNKATMIIGADDIVRYCEDTFRSVCFRVGQCQAQLEQIQKSFHSQNRKEKFNKLLRYIMYPYYDQAPTLDFSRYSQFHDVASVIQKEIGKHPVVKGVDRNGRRIIAFQYTTSFIKRKTHIIYYHHYDTSINNLKCEGRLDFAPDILISDEGFENIDFYKNLKKLFRNGEVTLDCSKISRHIDFKPATYRLLKPESAGIANPF